jgi:hypothetical protein
LINICDALGAAIGDGSAVDGLRTFEKILEVNPVAVVRPQRIGCRLQVLRSYAWLTGYTPLPPLWSLGNQQSRSSYYPESIVHEIASRYLSRHRISAELPATFTVDTEKPANHRSERPAAVFTYSCATHRETRAHL